MEIDEDDAALIDSFFLPGGILDPDEDGEGDIPAVTSFEDARVSRVPKNPWSGDSLHDGAGESAPRHLAIPPQVTKSPSACLRPPPGYSTSDLDRPKNNSFFSVEPNLFSSYAQASATVMNTTFLSDHHLLGPSIPPPGLLQPPSSKHRQKMVGLKGERMECSDTETPTLSETQNKDALQSKESLEINEATISRPSTPSPLLLKQTSSSSLITPQKISNLNSTAMAPTASQKMQMHPEVDGEHHKRGHDILDEVFVEDTTTPRLSKEIHKPLEEREKKVVSQNPGHFPMEMLTLEHIDKRESAASSLSSSSNGSMRQDESDKKTAHERFEDSEEHTKVPHPGTADLQDPAETTKEFPCQVFIDETHLQLSKGKKLDEAAQNIVQTVEVEALHQGQSFQKFFVIAISCGKAVARATTSVLDLKFLNTIEQMRQGTRERLLVFNQKFFAYSMWMMDVKEVIEVLFFRLVNLTTFLLVVASKIIAVLWLLTVQSWVYSLIEVFEEMNVAVCYIAFYYMPTFCSVLMRFLTLPHWTPHLLASLVVGSLCNQTQPGPLHYRLPALLEIPSLAFSNQVISDETEFRPRDNRACRSILRMLRFVLPIFFVADGFSNEFGTIMGVQGAGRLTTAYMMILVRKNLLSSPVGWGSWALQVLFSTYCPSWFPIDAIVLILGLSSVRLIRYLEVRRLKDVSKSNGRDNSW